MPDFVRHRAAEQLAAIHTGRKRQRVDAIDVDRGQRPGALGDVDGGKAKRPALAQRRRPNETDFYLVRLGLADAARCVTGTPDRIDADGSERDAGALLGVLELAAGNAGRVVRPYDEGKFGQEDRSEDE